MKNRLAHSVRLTAGLPSVALRAKAGALAKAVVLALAVIAASVPSLAAADQGDKMDATVRDRATRITGTSRVIVEFYSEPDVRAFGRGTAGRKLGQHAQVAE